MAKRKQQSKTARLLKKFNNQEVRTPIGTGIWLPNHSGIKSHREFTQTDLTAGSITFSNGTIITEDNTNLFWDDSNNKLGVGTKSPDGKIHIFKGTAGAVTANTAADGLVIEDNDDTGMSIISPDGKFSNLFFGAASSNAGSIIRWKHSTKILQIGTNFSAASFQLLTDSGTLALDIDSSQNFNFQDGTITTTGTASLGATAINGALTGSGSGHDQFSDFVLAEHIDWSLASQGTIHATNYVDNNTTYTGGTGITLTGTVFSTTDSEIVHDNLSGFVSNEHVDHSTVSITGGVGIDGGGDLTTSRSLKMDINQLTTETTIASGDFIAMVDITDSESTKITFENLEATISHDNIAGVSADDHHAQSHTIVSHSDTTATGTELDTLTDNSMADTLHRHSELSASDGTPDGSFVLDANANIVHTNSATIWKVDSTSGTSGLRINVVNQTGTVLVRIQKDGSERLRIDPAGIMSMKGTTGEFIHNVLTTTQRDALTAVNGMIIYNSSTNAFNFRENGSWVTK